MKILWLALLGLAIPALAVDTSDSLLRGGGTQRVAVSGGDTIGTYSVSVTTTSVATIRSAVTDRSRRRVCVKNNTALFELAIGSAADVTSNYYRIAQSTNTAMTSEFCTNSSAAIKGNLVLAPGQGVGGTVATGTALVIEETQSVP